MQQIKTYQFKLKPNKDQERCFAQWLGSCRYVYNLCLDYKKQLYTTHSINISKNDIQKEIAGIAKDVTWIGQVHSQTLQEVTDRLFKAYDGFFKGNGFPKFAKRGQYSSFTFKQGVKLHQNTCSVQLPKIGKVKYRKSQPIEGIIKTVNISKKADGWYISLACQVAIQPLAATTNTVGLDVGIKSFVVTSDGEVFDNPKYLYQYQKQLTKAQRSVFRKKKGSSNRKKAVQKLAKIHLKIRNTRKNFQHKISSRLIRENPGGEPQTIVVEDLKVGNLLKNPGGEPHKLAKSISDCGWYGFIEMLEYKAKWYGRTFIRVAPQYTSQDCSVCGSRNSELTLKDRQWTCCSCNIVHDRDVNAALNIRNKAVGSTASASKIYAPVGVVVEEALRSGNCAL